MWATNSRKKCSSQILLNSMPSRSTPPKQAHNHPNRDDTKSTLDPPRPKQKATHRHRTVSQLHQPNNMGITRRSNPIHNRNRTRLRPRTRHRMHRPRPLPQRRPTNRSCKRLPQAIPKQLHRSLTIRRRTPHLGLPRRTTRHTPKRRRPKHRNLLSRQIHHHHRQSIPTRNTLTPVTLFFVDANLKR